MTVAMAKPPIKLRRLMGAAVGPSNTLAQRLDGKFTVDVRFVPKADIQAAFGYYCWWARVLKFVKHHP